MQKTAVEATVILPTFGRADFIQWALKSAQQQTITNIEIFVVGDGASPATRDIVEKAASNDPRIRFFDNPKGERNGELHRHTAILQSTGKIICYLGHDDLWFPEHMETMALLLQDADFGHSLYTYLTGDQAIHGFLPLISDTSCRFRMLRHDWNRFGPTCAAHTRGIYFNLPYGWRPAPLTIWSDLYMWRQFISHPGCRFAGLPKTTTISFPRSLRKEYTLEQRLAELAHWFPRLSLPEEAQRLSMVAIESAANDLQKEITHLENMASANPKKPPFVPSPRPLAVALLLGKVYLLFEKLLPGKLPAFKNGILERMVARSGLFNRQFYLERYGGEITREYADPVAHYVKMGGIAGKHPSPGFDSDYYLTAHPDVLEAGINPLVHYILHGYREKRAAIKLPDDQGAW